MHSNRRKPLYQVATSRQLPYPTQTDQRQIQSQPQINAFAPTLPPHGPYPPPSAPPYNGMQYHGIQQSVIAPEQFYAENGDFLQENLDQGQGQEGEVMIPFGTDTEDGSLDECNVFVKYLPPELSDSDFHKLFKNFGVIVSSKIMVDQGTGKSLGYGFVRFAHPSASQKAIRTMNGIRVANKKLLCKLANVSPSSFTSDFNKFPILSSQTPSDNLYVKPLLQNTTEDDLRKLFMKFGPIVDCKVMVDRNTGQSRQIGFVRYENPEHAQRAIEEMNNYKLDPSSPPLTVKYADTNEQKQARKVLRNKQTGKPPPSIPPTFYPVSYPYFPLHYPFPSAEIFAPPQTFPGPSATGPYLYDPYPQPWPYGENGIVPDYLPDTISYPTDGKNMLPLYPEFDFSMEEHAVAWHGETEPFSQRLPTTMEQFSNSVIGPLGGRPGSMVHTTHL